MTTLRKILFGAASLSALAAAQSASAQATATATGTASVTIIQPISITAGAAMAFGKIVASNAVGTATVSTAGVVTADGGVTKVVTNGGATSQGVFTVNGESGQTYALTLPSSGTMSGGGLTLDTFTSNLGVSGVGTLTGGTQTLNIGATLHVPANTSPNTYTGTYVVTVAYN